MSFGAHALDRNLRDLQTELQALVTESRDLEADATYALLAGDRLTGVTAERARPALTEVEHLWRGVSLLDDLLSQTRAWLNQPYVDDRDAPELMVRLNGPSIALVAEPPVAGDGHARPQLASPASSRSRTLTPKALLTTLASALTAAHQVVDEVDAAWRELLPRLDRMSTEAHHLAAELPGYRPLAAAVAALETLPHRIMEDPLGAADELTQMESTLARVAVARAEIARLSEEVAGATRMLAGLEGLLAEGRDAFDHSRAEIASPEGLLAPVDPAVLHDQPGLRPWLARLERLVAEGDVARAGAGLARWRALADETLAVARQVAEANARPRRRRRELQGLLRAVRVKAGALGRAEDTLVTELADRAMRLLDVPCDLPAAETAVEKFLEGLRQPAPPSGMTGDAAGSVGDAMLPPDPIDERRSPPLGDSRADRRVGAPT
ncbi:MAG: hypothetical protein ACRD2C_20925 [Acidimicrobiales bacterium]